ncbi:unnamed protein product [Prorocentrum cordatum]|uniref:Uncharacterized protein n=1 Tax=Prorocentrum cordatum TaxID=2364126 RepID=A0ABN9TQZ8_9DINO|nr:unnamed protein product [Polarella glacialis]
MQTETDQFRSDFHRGAPGDTRAEVEIKKPRVATIGVLSVCELAVCGGGYDETFDPMWDPRPKRSSRCSDRCEKHSLRCQLRECRRGERACRRCLMSRIGTEQTEQMVEVSAELRERHRWSPKTMHYDCYAGDPLGEDLYQSGRDDELQATGDYGVYGEVATSTATDGKHIGGFPVARMKVGRVRWRFVATEIKHEVRERMIQVWDVRKVFFNSDLDETIYVQPGRELRPPARCWWLRKAMGGAGKVFYLPAGPDIPAVDEDIAAICRGDDLLADGSDEQLDELGELLKQQFEVRASARLGPGRPGWAHYLKRIIGYADKLPGSEEPSFFWTADPKHVDFTTRVDTEARVQTSSCPRGESYRPDTMHASKAAMQRASNPSVLMHARVQRLGLYYEGLQCKTYLIEAQGPCNLKIYSDSTAGRGMCSRVGVGKGENVAVYEVPGQAAVCPASVPRCVDREEFWFTLMTGVVVVVAAVFVLGCVCGCYAKNYLWMGPVQEAVGPAPGDADVYLTTRADAEVKTMSVQGFGTEPRPARCDGGARRKLFNAFLVVDLKQILRANGLRVNGLEDDLIIAGLIKKGSVLSGRQAKDIAQLRVVATMRGSLSKISPQDLSSPEAAPEWFETFKSECRDRPDEHCLQHPRDSPCLQAPLAWSFRDGRPVHLVVRDAPRGGSALLDFARGALADTREENRRGLEGRTGLREGEALLMRYPEVPGRAADTMRDTPQDLDIGWFSPSGELVEVAPLRARGLALTYSRSSNVAYGLEAAEGGDADPSADSWWERGVDGARLAGASTSNSFYPGAGVGDRRPNRLLVVIEGGRARLEKVDAPSPAANAQGQLYHCGAVVAWREKGLARESGAVLAPPCFAREEQCQRPCVFFEGEGGQPPEGHLLVAAVILVKTMGLRFSAPLQPAKGARRAAMGYAFAPLRLPMEMLRKALGAVAFVIPLAARKTAAATHKQRTS